MERWRTKQGFKRERVWMLTRCRGAVFRRRWGRGMICLGRRRRGLRLSGQGGMGKSIVMWMRGSRTYRRLRSLVATLLLVGSRRHRAHGAPAWCGGWMICDRRRRSRILRPRVPPGLSREEWYQLIYAKILLRAHSEATGTQPVPALSPKNPGPILCQSASSRRRILSLLGARVKNPTKQRRPLAISSCQKRRSPP